MAKEIENTMNGNNAYILMDINQETTNGLIVQLTQWVNTLPITDLKQQKLYTPYEPIPKDIPVLNVYISSFGGKTRIMQSILSMFNIATAKGAIIKTYNLAVADSCASMIAIAGTRGYRYMAQDATHTIHFGSSTRTAEHTAEIAFITKDFQRFNDVSRDFYLSKTNLKQKEVEEYYNIEGAGCLDSAQCLTKGICDWVITNDGRFVNKVEDLVNQKVR